MMKKDSRKGPAKARPAGKKPVKAAKPKGQAKHKGPFKKGKPLKPKKVIRTNKPAKAKPVKTAKKPVREAPKAAPKPKGCDVYFNGRFIGATRDVGEFVGDIKKKRRLGILPDQVNIVHYPEFNEIRINTDSGRTRRPLIIVENGKHKLTKEVMKRLTKGEIKWDHLVNHGIIEYLDAEEEENSYIAFYPKELTEEHTHLEMSPMALFGVSATLIPYPEYNRGDRINYGAKMVGQAIGLPATNFMIRTDTKFNILVSPQNPIVGTITDRIFGDYPYGQNIVIAIMCWDGYNLNDAVVLNRSSVERGMFRSFYFRTYDTIKKRYWGGQEDEIGIPEPGIKGHRGEIVYKDLGEDGIINLEIAVGSDSVLIGKTSPLRFLSGEEFTADIENKRETSLTIRYGEKGVVDRVLISENLNGWQMIKIRIRDERIPELGDKFASRHGQKGVVSLLVPQEDMPFTSDGVVPDLIFNPHGIPSRMTIGQLLEILGGKAGALSGQKIDSSAFSHMKEEDIRKTMTDMGFRNDGKQALYDGRTGEMYKVLIFTGMTYMMKLDHMVADKIHARGRGPVTILTKQPTEGRAKRGGLRLGEMEQQCLVAHGAALTLKERFSSDNTMIPICNRCGLIAIHDRAKNKTYCGICKDSEVTWVQTAYAFKLAMDELKSMGIYPNIKTKEI